MISLGWEPWRSPAEPERDIHIDTKRDTSTKTERDRERHRKKETKRQTEIEGQRWRGGPLFLALG